MGLSDRDYMHERHREVLNARPRESRPFTPPKETSALVMVGWWITIAFILFKAYDWWHQDRQQARAQPRTPVVARAAPTPVAELPRVPRAHPAPAAMRADNPAPQQMPYRSGTVYLCRNPDRSTFWAQAPCSSQGAVLERMAQVPEDLPFDAQVRIAEERRRALTPPPAVQVSETSAATPFPAVDRKAVCDPLDDRVRELDAMARQPQTASMQDWIRSERKSVRDAQFRMRC